MQPLLECQRWCEEDIFRFIGCILWRKRHISPLGITANNLEAASQASGEGFSISGACHQQLQGGSAVIRPRIDFIDNACDSVTSNLSDPGLGEGSFNDRPRQRYASP